MDTLTREMRSKQMSLVRSKNTKPELLLRRFVFDLGYRYRIHNKDLPGKPDMVFSSRKEIIFMHGCYWHGHTCRLGRIPKSRVAYWIGKTAGNRDRDKLTLRRLRGMGWRCLVIWECELRDHEALKTRLTRFLDK